jgi:hypothetical protein
VGEINPGFPPNRRSHLNDPARAVGGQGKDIQQMAMRMGALERLLSSYREKQVEVRKPDGSFQSITVLAKEGGSGSGDSVYASAIAPSKFRKVGGVWKVSFTPAKLWEHSLKNLSKEHEIKLDDAPLTNDPAPEKALAGGDNEVWLSYKITYNGAVSAPVTLTIGEAPEKKPLTPKRPEYEGDGVKEQDGILIQKIGTITVNRDSDPTWKPECTSSKADVFLPIIVDSAPENTKAQSVYYKYDKGSDIFKMFANGTEDDGTVGLLAEETSERSKYITIAQIGQKKSEPQIHVEAEGEGEGRKIIVKGNDVSLNLTKLVKGLTVKDGLVTSAEEDTDDGSEGWTGTVEFHHRDLVDLSNENFVLCTFKKGRLTKVEYKVSSGVTYVDLPGTEDAPGAATFESYNTNPPIP